MSQQLALTPAVSTSTAYKVPDTLLMASQQAQALQPICSQGGNQTVAPPPAH